MQLVIKTKNIELTESLETIIAKRMDTIEKMVDAIQESAELFVEIEKETRHHNKGDVFGAEAMVHLPGKNLVATAHGDDLLIAITQVKEELVREIKKYKTKAIELPRRKYRKEKNQIF